MTVSSSIRPYAPIASLPAYQAGRCGRSRRPRARPGRRREAGLERVAVRSAAVGGRRRRRRHRPDQPLSGRDRHASCATPWPSATGRRRRGDDRCRLDGGAVSTGAGVCRARRRPRDARPLVRGLPDHRHARPGRTGARADARRVHGRRGARRRGHARAPRSCSSPTRTTRRARRSTSDELRWLAERLAGRCLLVVDQAYDEFDVGPATT